MRDDYESPVTEVRYIITHDYLHSIYITSSPCRNILRVLYSLEDAFEKHFDPAALNRLATQSFITE
jgi:hypothetical protein